LAKLAIILHEGSPGPRELRLSRILEFFGVPRKLLDVSKFTEPADNSEQYAVFGTIQTIATALQQRRATDLPISHVTAFYAYADEQRDGCSRALQSLVGDANLSLQEAPAGNLLLNVSSSLGDLTGPMAGLELPLRLGSEDALLMGASAGGESKPISVISAGGATVFLRFENTGIPFFFCASSRVVDIDQPVGPGFYDIKDHFCSVVPLVMFSRCFFPEVAWRPQELGACLIIDDPLLRAQYGFCDFAKLRNLMQRHGFTTNIAFIPWNWRRTSVAAGNFFRSESAHFSISIHGCDHTAGEFGATSPEVLETTARLAQSRMRNHETRTGIQHDSIMVFPQGIFSSACPEVLKHNGFLAVVNTETVPIDSQNSRTRIRDVWDVAIMRYGTFPIFTRRYAFHGLENFAFDLLLGKPCLIVAHHDFFKDGGDGLIALIGKIKSLNCSLHWRPLGEVIRRACRRRCNGAGAEEVEMYGNELLVGNPSDRALEVNILKRKSEGEAVSEIRCDGLPMKWVTDADYVLFGEQIPPHGEKRFRVFYDESAPAGNVQRSVRYEVSVAARRLLSEFRDDYLARSSFLSGSADLLRKMLKKAT
jgi:hypothetical protein